MNFCGLSSWNFLFLWYIFNKSKTFKGSFELILGQLAPKETINNRFGWNSVYFLGHSTQITIYVLNNVFRNLLLFFFRLISSINLYPFLKKSLARFWFGNWRLSWRGFLKWFSENWSLNLAQNPHWEEFWETLKRARFSQSYAKTT